jgi:beta-barrel assembly-enhancing protease
MSIEAIYFDGETARDNPVTVRRVGNNLEFLGEHTALSTWSLAGLHPIDPPVADQPFRITHDLKPGARLILRDRKFIDDLLASNKHLRGGYSWRHIGQVVGWTTAGLAGLAGLVYLTMTILPQQVAGLLPKTWRDNMGQQVISSITAQAKRCDTAGSKAAISAMIAALAEGGSELPPISVEIYDMSLVNAFAAPGGRIILTRGLINEASDPDEVVGVLAHELGHTYHLHPEAQLVRLFGLQILASAVSGGTSGDMITSAAGLAAILRYTRAAETEADTFAREVMTKASIDTMGLKRFFEKIMKLEGGKPKGDDNNPSALDRIGNVFSTHPGTEDRIKEIKPLPDGQKPIIVMTDEQWQALRKACN